MKTCEIAIIGAGFAGASTAWHLIKNGVKDIIILEQEELPGMHSSGLNASMVRQFEEDGVIARCVSEGANFIVNPPSGWDILLDKIGSLILFKHSRLEKVKKALGFVTQLGVESAVIERKNAVEKVSLLAGADFDHAVFTASDGVVDINTLLWSYLKDAKRGGCELKLKQRVSKIEKRSDGTFVIKTENDSYAALKVINASGAWVGEIGKLAGATDLKLTPTRRHLYTTEVMKSVQPRWPFVWDIDNQYYFRPESGGLLLGPCDEEVVAPGTPSTASYVREMLAEKLSKYCPSLTEVKIATEWAGLRTFAPDKRFVIGEDVKLKNFFWVAGLGGWGVTSSYCVGKLAADAVLSRCENIPNELKPERFR